MAFRTKDGLPALPSVDVTVEELECGCVTFTTPDGGTDVAKCHAHEQEAQASPPVSRRQR